MEIFEKIQEDAHTLGVDLPSGELAALMQENNASAESIRIVSKVFGHLREKKWDATVSMYLKTSRLPRKNPRISSHTPEAHFLISSQWINSFNLPRYSLNLS